MFDVGWQELFLIAIVALIAIGPKDLPIVMRAVARFVRKMRGLSHEFQSAMSEVMREAELDDLKRKMEAAGRTDLGETVRKAVDPTGSFVSDFDPEAFADRVKRSVEGGPPTGPASDAPQPAAPQTAGPPTSPPPEPTPAPPPADAAAPPDSPPAGEGTGGAR
jgi:sec-independent protein translocase protein TatB